MKMKFSLFVFAILCMSNLIAQNPRIKFDKMCLDQATQKASSEDKLVLALFSDSENGPTKWMQQYVLPNEVVREFYENNYILVFIEIDNHLNAKEIYGNKISDSPTFVVFDQCGNEVIRKTGAMIVSEFIEFGKSALKVQYSYN